MNSAATGDGFTMDLRLCDESGMADLAMLNRLRSLSRLAPYEGQPFPCTGSAHLAGEHIRCVSTAHLALPVSDALPDRPERIEEPLPEDLERLLRDPEIVTTHDHAFHFWFADYVRRTPDAPVTREAYLSLFALYEKETDRRAE